MDGNKHYYFTIRIYYYALIIALAGGAESSLLR